LRFERGRPALDAQHDLDGHSAVVLQHHNRLIDSSNRLSY
jgi:hypothetical protein